MRQALPVPGGPVPESAQGRALHGATRARAAEVSYGGRRRAPVPLSVAPMMDLTDRHFRYFARRISRRALLYSEMIHARAVLRGDRERLLAFDPSEAPVALQLGGDDPVELAEAAAIGEDFGYAEIDLNVGCPSERVQSGNFGACLMATPEVVAQGVRAMRAATSVPITVKHRIGIDEADAYEDMARFVEVVAEAGADAFVVHARKAWLSGLSPKENRSVPPLRYDDVYRLKASFPYLMVELNGGVRTLDEAERHLLRVDGVMIGRAAYEDPYVLAGSGARFHGDDGPAPTREEVVCAMLPYVQVQLEGGAPLTAITRHMLGLFRGRPGGKAWRRVLTERSQCPGAGPEVLLEGLEAVRSAVALGGRRPGEAGVNRSTTAGTRAR